MENSKLCMLFTASERETLILPNRAWERIYWSLREDLQVLIVWCSSVQRIPCKPSPSHSRLEVLAPCRCSSCRHTPASCRQKAGAWSVAPCTPPPPCRGKTHQHNTLSMKPIAWSRCSIVIGWEGGSSSDDGILIEEDTAGGCNISWSWGEGKDKGRAGVGGGPPFSVRCLGLHTSLGDEESSEKGKGQRARPSWTLCPKH